MPMKKNNPGCGGSDCCRPPCSGVWDAMRGAYSQVVHRMYGTLSTLETNPMTRTTAIVESFVSGGVTFYQCAIGSILAEAFDRFLPDGTPPPNRYIWDNVQNLYSASQLTIGVSGSNINLLITLGYRYIQYTNPDSTLLGLGYTKTTSSSGFIYDLSSSGSHRVSVQSGFYIGTPIWDCRFESSRSTSSSSVTDPTQVIPPWNPGNMYAEADFS